MGKAAIKNQQLLIFCKAGLFTDKIVILCKRLHISVCL